MNLWSQEERVEFLRTINNFWPNAFTDGPLGKDAQVWVQVAQRYQYAVALQAIQDLFEGQDRRKIPTIAAFRHAAAQVQAFIDGAMRRREEAASSQVETFSPQEIAMDDSFWEPVFDGATSPKHLELLKSIRKLMTGGAGGMEIARYLGDVVNFNFQKSKKLSDLRL